MKAALLGVLTLVFAILLCVKWAFFARVTFRNVKQIVETSEEQRKGRTYDSWGYGYVARIVSVLPEPWIFPVTRYTDYTHNIDTLLPLHIERIDPRVLIGIHIPESDVHEAFVATAYPLDGNWAFHTINDYDTLSAIHFTFDPETSLTDEEVTLYKDSTLKTILGRWVSHGTILPLPAPIRPFSFTRGSRDFIIKVTPAEHITGISVYGIKVDLHGYQVVDREGDNFTAIHQDFLADIRKNNNGDWVKFLSHMNGKTL